MLQEKKLLIQFSECAARLFRIVVRARHGAPFPDVVLVLLPDPPAQSPCGGALGLPELVAVVELGLELAPVRREGPQELLRLRDRRVRLLFFLSASLALHPQLA